MKTLPTKFHSNSKTFTQLKRVGRIALFRIDLDNVGHVGYEVVRIHSHNGYEIMGRYMEPAEHMPPNSAWGMDGFSYGRDALDHAEARFATLLDEETHAKDQPSVVEEKPQKKIAVTRQQRKLNFKLKLKR